MLIICNLLHHVNIKMLKMSKIIQKSINKCSNRMRYAYIKAQNKQKEERKCSQV